MCGATEGGLSLDGVNVASLATVVVPWLVSVPSSKRAASLIATVPRLTRLPCSSCTPASLLTTRSAPVFVSVWASWNVGSLDEAATLADFARDHRAEVAFLGIDSEDELRAARVFSKRFHGAFPSIWDPIGRLAAAWGPVPTTLVFDRRHVLVQKIAGAATRDQLDAALRRVTRR